MVIASPTTEACAKDKTVSIVIHVVTVKNAVTGYRDVFGRFPCPFPGPLLLSSNISILTNHNFRIINPFLTSKEQGQELEEGSRLATVIPNKNIDSENMQLPTPIIADRLEYMLNGFDPMLKHELISGFTNGFDIGFRGEVNSDTSVNNLRSTMGLEPVVSQEINKELLNGRIEGPFPVPPFEKFQLNPIGIVPKKEPNSYRMIVDLSFPPGHAINDHIDDSFAKVQYSSVYDAVEALVACGPNAYMAKTDIKKAFRLIPISPKQYHLLCIRWEDVYFFDKTLPMGCRSSCKIFQSFSDALKFIASSKGIQWLINYLDDFLFVAATKQKCLEALRKFRAICAFIGVPLAIDKTFLPSQIMIFLGLEYDSIAEVIRLPADKLARCREGIKRLLGYPSPNQSSCSSKSKKSSKVLCTLRELQSILGLLSFACSVIVPGRAFLRRLFALTAGVAKPYFFVKITNVARKDLRVWEVFLDSFNGVSLYKEQLFLKEDVCHFYTDASKNLGCGAVFGRHWFSLHWPSIWWTEQNITFLELVPIVLALEAWGHLIRNRCLIIHTDNQALVHVINSQSSKEVLVMCFIRKLVLKALLSNVLIQAIHVPGSHNVYADLLSRLQVPRFFQLHPEADKLASVVSPLPLSMDSSAKL